MPALQEAKDLIKKINKANVEPAGKERLLYVNNWKHQKVKNRKLAWMLRRPDHGLSPIVSPMQNSPVVGQGGYIQLEASPIITRHIKRFTAEELQNLASPDPNYRIDAKYHLAQEMIDSDRRIYDTMEFIAHSAMARGEVKYTLVDAVSNVVVDIAFPVGLETVSATWDNTSTDIVADVDKYIKKFKYRAGKKPDTMRMTTDTWNWVKANTSVRNQINNWLRVNKRELPVITPELVASACDWPKIEIYDERTHVQYTYLGSSTITGDGTNAKTIALPGTWGISVGDTILCKYVVNSKGQEDWGHEAVVTAVTHGQSIAAVLANGKTIATNDVIAVKPTFFPEQKVLFVADEFVDNSFLIVPFGLEYSNSNIRLANWYGPRKDVFEIGNEPNLAAARRNWHEFGVRMGNPNKQMSVQVKV